MMVVLLYTVLITVHVICVFSNFTDLKSQITASYHIDKESNTYSLTVYSDGSSIHNVIFSAHDDINSKIQEFCRLVAFSPENCDIQMDNISAELQKLMYTPSSMNSTVEDFTSNRTDVVKYFADKKIFKNYNKYLEIGTDKDVLFSKARAWFNYTVGVDPISGGTHRMTSDAFFAQNTEYFDVIFIDGMHEAKQVFKDIQNALLCLSPGGTIIMHDCNPRSFQIQNGTYNTGDSITRAWTGDTWKTAVMMRLIPDIEIVIVDIDYGVGVIRRRENKHTLPIEWIEYLSVCPLCMLEYELLAEYRSTLLRLMSIQDMRHWVEEEFV